MAAFWVFGYGSLMWNPGFAFDDSVAAVLEGHHRSFCVWSRHYRGTPEAPGLVLGLNPGGGHCEGTAFCIRPEDAAEVRDYLRERELCGYAYVEATLPVRLRDGRTCEAYTFIADRAHRHYAGDLPVDEAAEIIMRAEGVGGLNRDYLINTVRALERHGVHEPPLHALLREVERRTGEIDAGGGI
ncbi:gamma-glutamylcyclotransferase [Novispirillum sp. DQ9]|uniref:gamma-glutamylcyclotransferase n=1 Tax=Novispirillum sp. DQ9 TaxID=3398612 RepID=UPI003C7ABEDC